MANAGIKAMREARRMGLGLDGLTVALAGPPQVIERIIYRVPPGEMVLPFGKYKGRALAEVFADDPGYVRWFAENARTADPLLIEAAGQLVEKEKS